jgi:hypothetical protein
MQSCGILDVSGPNILQHLGWASVMAISSSTRLRPLLIAFVFPNSTAEIIRLKAGTVCSKVRREEYGAEI